MRLNHTIKTIAPCGQDFISNNKLAFSRLLRLKNDLPSKKTQ